jgi:plastocyanin
MTRLSYRAAGVLALTMMPAACGDRMPEHVIAVQNFTYTPAGLEVAGGDSVLFVNHDVVPHTATARDNSWNTGEIGPGDSARVAVRNAGEYYCVFHPNMTARIIVVAR